MQRLLSTDARARQHVSAPGQLSVAKAFGQVVRELRGVRGLSQEALAELGDFDRTYPSLLERGLRTPSLGAVFRLADALGVSAQTLVMKTRERLREKAV